MYKVEERHFKIINDILLKYPYTFYMFGSRVKDNAKRLSDVDLCFFEDIPLNIRDHIDEDFENSDLPYKVDIADWNTFDITFRQLISDDLVCIQASNQLLAIENNTIKHFTYLPQLLGCNVKKNLQTTVINCALNSSMFNIICNTNFVDKENLELSITELIDAFKGQPFAWWLGPSSKPKHLGNTLKSKGFVMETAEYAMKYMLANFNENNIAPSVMKIVEVNNVDALKDFILVLQPYDKNGATFFKKIMDFNIIKDEKLFVGYEHDEPVSIGMLCFSDKIAGIFSVLTAENQRKKGFGTAMMNHLLRYAKDNKYLQAVLLASSSEGFSIYEKLGFRVMGKFECYEYS